jgi:hypothetical protein
VIIVLTAAALAVSAPAYASSPLAGWWPLYEGSGTTGHDTSGNRDNGTLSGNANWTSGYFGSALSFDGSTGRVDVPDSAALEPKNAVSAGAYVKGTAPGDFKYIVSKGSSGCIASSYALYTGANGGLEFYVSQNGGLTYSVSPDAGIGIWDGNWHFVVGTYDGSSVRLYVDGKQVGSGTPATGAIGYGLPTNNDLWLGHYEGCSQLDFQGSLDEPTVWTTALSAQQISGGYALLSALHGWISRLPSFPMT